MLFNSCKSCCDSQSKSALQCQCGRLCVADGTCCEESSKHDSVVDCVLPMGLVVKRAQSMTVWLDCVLPMGLVVKRAPSLTVW